MTYSELLKETAAKKRDAIAGINKALTGPAGFLVKAEIQRNPGGLAWYALAQWFVEQLAEHIDEFIEEGEDVAREVIEIYESYEDGDSDLYQILPIEAQLFEKEE